MCEMCGKVVTAILDFRPMFNSTSPLLSIFIVTRALNIDMEIKVEESRTDVQLQDIGA